MATSATLPQDLKYAFRQIARRRSLTIGIVLTIALVIAGSTAIFTILYGVIFRPFPLPNADRLVLLWETNRETGVSHLPITEGAYPAYLRARSNFEAVAGFMPKPPLVEPVELIAESKEIQVAYASPELFPLLDSHAILGRTFSHNEALPGAPKVAVLSHRFWQQQFQGKQDVIGQSLRVREFGEPALYTIVGVMPEDFTFPYPLQPKRIDAWFSFQYFPEIFSEGGNFHVIAKLKKGVPLEQAQRQINGIAQQLASEHPRVYGKMSVQVVPLHAESLRDAWGAINALAGALAFLMLIGCANLVHLAMAGTASRDRDLRTRLALGATLNDLLRLAIIENTALAAIGSSLGLLLTRWCIAAILSRLPAQLFVANAATLEVDFRASVFAFLLMLCIGLFLGSCRIARFRKALAESANQNDTLPKLKVLRRRGAMLLVAEVASAFALTSGALMMIRSLQNAISATAPTDPGKLITMNMAPPLPNDFSNEHVRATNSAILRAAQESSAAESAALTDQYPFVHAIQPFAAKGASGPIATGSMPAEFHIVSPEFAKVIGLELRAGRWFEPTNTGFQNGVAVINDVMARRYFGGAAAIGASLTTTLIRSKEWPKELRVVGVVHEPARLNDVQEAPPTVYVPLAQAPVARFSVLVRTRTEARALKAPLTQSILASAPGYSVSDVLTGQEILTRTTARASFVSEQLTASSLLAIGLACLGVYGIVAFQTSQRSREIAIRMAVGSTNQGVMQLILQDALSLILFGITIGAPFAWMLIRLLASVQSGVEAINPLEYVGLALTILLLGGCASWLPAKRASALDPVVVLRAE